MAQKTIHHARLTFCDNDGCICHHPFDFVVSCFIIVYWVWLMRHTSSAAADGAFVGGLGVDGGEGIC